MNVNLDIPSGGKLPVKDMNVIHANISRVYDVDVICSIFYLPFKDCVFNHVFSFHLLEHLNTPSKAIEEIKRVVKHTVVIKVPNGVFFKYGGEDNGHIYSWTELTLANFLKQFFSKVIIYKTFRITPYKNKVKRLIEYLKTFFLFTFSKDKNELTAICSNKTSPWR